MTPRFPLLAAMLLLVAFVLGLAALAWSSTEDAARAGLTRATGLTAAALGAHLLLAPAAAFVAGRIDRRRDRQARAGGVVWAMIAAGFVATAAAAAGVALLPGPWWGALTLSGVAAAVATVASWASVPLVRPVDQRAAGPESMAVLFPLLLLPPALALGGLARSLLAVLS